MRIAILALACCAATAAAQSEVIMTIDDTTLRPGESTVVTLSAAWPPSEYAFASIRTAIDASVDVGVWSDLEVIPVMDGPGATPGVASGSDVAGIFAWQVNFPPAGAEPDFSNPIRFWRGTYTAPDVVSAPIDVELTTMTSEFEVYFMPRSLETRSYLGGLVEGSGVIRVIPAPMSAMVLGLGGVLAVRRRR